MNPAELVESEVERERRAKIFPLLGKCVGEPRQAADHHLHGKVLSLDVRCAYTLRVRISPAGTRNGRNYFGRRVTVFASTLLRLRVDLYQLREVNAGSETVSYGVRVGGEAVRSKLETSASGCAQLFRKVHRVANRAAA